MLWTAIFLGPVKEPWAGLREELGNYRIEKVLAADAGGLLALRAGLPPQLVVGDMDSLTKEEERLLETEGIPIERWPAEKDYTDFELLLRHQQMRGVRHLLVVGGIGGRVDHTLVNLDILSRRGHLHTHLIFPEGKAVILRRGEEVRMKSAEGRVVSVVPLTEWADVERSSGLRWPLSGIRIKKGAGRTVHNVATGGEVLLKLKSGRVLMVLFREGAV